MNYMRDRNEIKYFYRRLYKMMQQPAELKIPFAKTIIRCAGIIEAGGWK